MASHNFLEGFFPVKRDFYRMISDQAKATTNGIKKLHNWLNSRSEEDYKLLFSQADEANRIRFNMEHNLIEAFSTPFDRQDIYSLSVEMARIFEYAKSTLQEMDAFAVSADLTILNMVQQLNVGTDQLAEAMGLLREEPLNSQVQMVNIRKVQLTIEEESRAGRVGLFKSEDLIYAMK